MKLKSYSMMSTNQIAFVICLLPFAGPISEMTIPCTVQASWVKKTTEKI